MPSHVLRLMCHCDCVIIAPGSPQAQCLQALINQSTIDRPLYRECKSTCTQKKTQTGNINLLSIVVFHLTWKVSKEARFWLTSGQTASIQGHWQTQTQIIVDRFQYRARALYAPDEIWDESLCQHKSPAKPDLEAGLGRQHTYTPSTCHSEDADSPVLHALFSALLQRDFRHSQGWGTWVWPRDKLV